MKKTLLRIAAAAMAAVMTLGLSSCSGGRGKSKIASKENIYSAQKIELPTGITYISRVMYSNDKLYLIGENVNTSGEGENMVYSSKTVMQILSIDGTLEKELVLSDSDDGSNGWISSSAVDSDGSVIALKSIYEWNEQTGESKEDWMIVKYGPDGTAMGEKSLMPMIEAAKKESGQDYFYVYNMMCTDSDLVFAADNVLSVADKDGNFKYLIKGEGGDNTWMNGLYQTGDGRLFTCISKNTMVGDEYKFEQSLCEVDLANRRLGESFELKSSGSLMNGTDKYDLLVSKDSGLYGYNIKTGAEESLINWIKSGFDTSAMETQCTTVLGDGRILCVTHDYKMNGMSSMSWGGDDLIINLLTKVDPSALPDKKSIKLYSMWLDMGIKRRILEFNKNNAEYEIEYTSYAETNDYNDGISRMNNDMISGNIPDIIILNDQLPVDSYISKGLLADVYAFMDKDPDFNRGDYVESVFKAYERKGKLYEIIPSFSIHTIAGKASVVGTEPGWTVDEFIQFLNANPDKKAFFDDMTKDGICDLIISNCYNDFIDKDTGKCSFDSDDFVKILEFANTFPKEINYDNYDESYWNERESSLRDNKVLLTTFYASGFKSFKRLEQGQFGETITFKGYPGASGNGATFYANTKLAITAKASNPDGAWEFVKYFLSDEFQDQYATPNSYEFPIKRSALEKTAEAAKERPYWENENGEKEYYDDQYWIGGESIKLDVNTDADNQRIMELINSTTNVYCYDSDIEKIINEETASYFDGAKSAKEVAGIIQNRISNYIAENR